MIFFVHSSSFARFHTGPPIFTLPLPGSVHPDRTIPHIDKNMSEEIRIDKWLWAVRIFKSRSDAAEACRMNRVLVNGSYCKPSRELREGDTVAVRKLPVTYTFRVKGLVSNRQPAKNVPLYMENLTPQSELDKLNPPRETIFISRDRGTGRPTKKERREIDALMDDLYLDESLLSDDE